MKNHHNRWPFLSFAVGSTNAYGNSIGTSSHNARRNYINVNLMVQLLFASQPFASGNNS